MSFSIFSLVLTAAVFHSIWNFAARKMSGNLAVFWFALWTAIILMLPVIVGLDAMLGTEALWSMTRDGYGYMIATGVLHMLYFLLLSRTYEYGEISVVYPVARGSGIGVTAICAWLLLNEDITWIGASGIGLVCVGILSMGMLVVQRSARAIRGFKSALGVGSTIVAYSLVDKVGVGIVNPVLYIWVMFLITALMLWPVVVSRHRGTMRHIATTSWRSILVIGIGSAGTYMTILFAMTMAPVSYIVALREFAVVVGAFLGVVFLKERLTPGKVFAILAITLGLVFIKMG